MQGFTLRPATRTKTKMRVVLAGVSGSGKTFSALLMASGMAAWEKIALIDTENGSGDLYAHLGAYNVIPLDPPYTPERYIKAIEACESAGMEVIVIDSMSHEWEGKGGILEIKDSMTGNSFTNWGQLTPRHNAFVNRMLSSKAHIIATLRSKQDYVMVKNDKGKDVPQKMGLKPITREGVDYEFTLVFDIGLNHYAIASKDRTGIFMPPDAEAVVPVKITAETGKQLIAWCAQGIDAPTPPPAPVAPPPPVTPPPANVPRNSTPAGRAANATAPRMISPAQKTRIAGDWKAYAEVAGIAPEQSEATLNGIIFKHWKKKSVDELETKQASELIDRIKAERKRLADSGEGKRKAEEQAAIDELAHEQAAAAGEGR